MSDPNCIHCQVIKLCVEEIEKKGDSPATNAKISKLLLQCFTELAANLTWDEEFFHVVKAAGNMMYKWLLDERIQYHIARQSPIEEVKKDLGIHEDLGKIFEVTWQEIVRRGSRKEKKRESHISGSMTLDELMNKLGRASK